MTAQKLCESVYVIPGPTNVGVVACRRRLFSKKTPIYLIDSGMDSDDAARIYRELEELFPAKQGGFRLVAVINTHSHADHSGGNAWFVQKTGCGVWISEREAGSLVNTELQGAVTCGGHPMPHMQASYYVPQVSRATKIISEKTKIRLGGGMELTFMSLPGHYFEMLGVVCKNRQGQTVLFAGDALFGREHILKYWISFLYDVEKFLETLEKINNSPMNWYVPSHGQPVQEIAEVVEMNQMAVLSTIRCILIVLDGDRRLSFEQILKEVADRNEIKFRTAQYLLIGSTIKAYLYYLYENKKIDCSITNNMLLWRKISD